MSELSAGERLIFSVYVGGFIDKRARDLGRKAIERNTAKDFLIGMGIDMGVGMVDAAISGGKSDFKGGLYRPKGTGRQGKGLYVEQYQKVLEKKIFDRELLNVYVLYQKDYYAVEQGDDRGPGFVNEIVLMCTQFASDYNALELIDSDIVGDKWVGQWIHTPDKQRETSSIYKIHRFDRNTHWVSGAVSSKRWKEEQVVLSFAELAVLWHLPHEQMAAMRGIEWSGLQPPREVIENPHGAIIGDHRFAGTKRRIRIHPEDRTTHMNIIGKTGVGKSTFLHNQIHQDIRAGYGVGVIDPHGQLVRDILQVSIPEDRRDDVVLLDIANEQHPPPLNPLAGSKDANYAAGEIVAILEKIGPPLPMRVADTLTAALVTLRNEPTPTVRDVIRLFDDLNYRHRLINQVNDPVTQEFWQNYEQSPPSLQDDLSYPVRHRMRRFYRNPLMYPMLCHPQPLRFDDLIRKRKIVLVSLGIDSRKFPPPEQQLMGAVLVSQLLMSAMSSLQLTTPFFLYIDEVQKFTTVPVSEIFEEARKYKLRLIVANQYLGQLGRLLDSIMGTVGATVVFQASPKDAGMLASYFGPEMGKDDLEQLDKYSAAIKMRFKGNTMPAFRIATRPAPNAANIETKEAIQRAKRLQQHSIDLHTPMTRDQVLDWLNSRYPPQTYSARDSGPDGPQDNPNWEVPTNDS